MSMNVHKELPSVQKRQLVLTHLVHTSAAATMVITEMASLVMVSNYFVPFYLLNSISYSFIRYVFTVGSVSSSGLRTFALIVSAHLYCARKFTYQVINRALSTKMNNDRADAHCYSFAWI